ncbi:MAG: efflux RND transporter permease subunit, partial [Sulfurifustis sp.]
GDRTTRVGRAADYVFNGVAALYRRMLEVALRHRWKVILGSLIFFAASFYTITYLNKEFMPPQDQGTLLVRMQTPEDSSLDYTDSKFRAAEEFFKSRPEVDRYFSAVGGFSGTGQVNTGILFVSLKPRGQRGIDPQAGHELSQQELMNVTRDTLRKIPDLKATVQDLSLRGFAASIGFPIEFVVQGPSWDRLAEYSQTIIQKMNETGLMTDINSDYREGKPEIQIIPDRTKAAARGVSVTAISQTVNATVGGVVVGQYSTGGHRYDVRVRLQEQERDRAEQIKRLFVRNNRGELIPLSEVVQLTEHPSLSQISRYNRERAIKIWANVKTGQSQEKALAAAQDVARSVLPQGYHIQFVGGSQSFKESFSDLGFALILGLFVSYMVLASQFNSFVHPVTVLMALPFSVSGAFLALLVSNQSLNIYSFIGLILLMGIVKKNSILLVDFTNQVRDRGIALRPALLEACPIRLRPILMTSVATIAAALPLAFAFGPGAESRVPMAIAVIGGVLVSTLLTLFVVPCVYELFAKLERGRGDAILRQKEIAEATKEMV